MGSLERLFRPDEQVSGVQEIDLEGLWNLGIRGLILDLDNTVVPWRSSAIPPAVSAWAARARELGFRLVFASNTRRYARLAGVAKALGAGYVRGVSKPRRGGFRAAAAMMGLPVEAVAAIGDQLLTDVLAAKRLGMRAILVKRLDTREFVVTQLNRRLEALILRRLEARSGKEKKASE